MNARKILLYAGGGLAGAAMLRYVYRNILLAKQWDYNVDNFKLVEITPNLKANMYFSIINKSAFKGMVKDIEIKIFSQGKQLSEIKQPELITIQPDGVTRLFVSIAVNPVQLFTNWNTLLAQILVKKDIELDFIGQMKLKTPFGWSVVPIKFSNTGRNLYNLYKEYY